MDEENVFLEEIGTRNSNPFLEDVASRNAIIYDSQFFDPAIFTGITGVGESMFDKRRIPFIQLENLEEIRAQRQPWIAKTGAMLGRIGVKVAAEIAKMPGVLGGVSVGAVGQLKDAVTGEDNTDFVQTAVNNAWIRGIEQLEEGVKEGALPVYVKKAVKEGNLWDNISSIDFWATEGADGIGYIASMLVPGAVINKYGLGAKLLGIDRLAEMAATTKKADNLLNIMGKAGITGKNADLWTGTIANTLFESSAEARGAMDEYKNQLDQKLASGKISQLQYDNDIKKQSEIGRNVFVSNVAILIGPNAMVSKMLWGGARNKAVGSLLSVEEGSLLKTIADPAFKIKAARVAKSASLGGLREGFWEEGMQSTITDYFRDNPDASITDFIGELPKAYIETLNTTEGQKAIFLGALFGSVLDGFSGAKSRKKERESTNKLIELGNSRLADLYNVFKGNAYVKDENGNTVYDEVTGEPIPDETNAVRKAIGLNNLETLSTVYDIAVEEGDTKTVNQIKDIISTHVIMPFIINDNLGVDVLRQHLEASKNLQDISDREKSDKQKFIDDTITKANKLKKDYNLFQDFGPSAINLNEIDATTQEKVDFYNQLSTEYIGLKSRKYFLQKEEEKSKEQLREVVNERSLQGFDDFMSNNRLKNQLRGTDIRIDKAYKDYTSYTNALNEIKEQENAFWDGKSATERFNKEIKAKREEQRLSKQKENEINEAQAKINQAKTIEEVDKVEFGDLLNPLVIEEIKSKRKKEILEEQAQKDKATIDSNEQFEEEQAQKDTEAENQYNYISNNFNIGEEITIPDSFNVKDEFKGETATIKNIKEDSITLELPDGTTLSINRSSFFNEYYSEDSNYSTEGSEKDSFQEPILDTTSGNVFEDKNQARIIITDNKLGSGEKLSFVSQAALDFERSPVDKIGQEKHVEINTTGKLTENQQKALDMYNANDYSDIDFLINYLPLNVKLTESVSAPLETKSDTSEAYNSVFDKTTKQLRKVIIKELAINKTKLEDITVPIAGQWNGDIQIEEKPIENLLTGLYEFSGDINKIQKEDFYFVDDFGTLKNVEDEIFPVGRRLAKGEVYLKIHTAAGKPFPLKLNVQKLSKDKAEVLYELYKYRFNDFIEGGQEGENKPISTLDNDIFTKIKELFEAELKLFNKAINDITIKDLIDFLVWEGSKNKKSQLRFTQKGKLLILNKSFSQEEYNTPEVKEEFISTLTNNKRHQIKFKTKTTDSNNLNIDESRPYLEYLITNGILNTNAKIGQPTFAGKTTMYLAPDQVKVNNKLSEFNKDIPKTYTKRLIGTNVQLKKKASRLFKNQLTLTEDETQYTDEKGIIYQRVSTLKDSAPNLNQNNVYNAAKRGNVVDELTRLFFSKNNISESEFIKHGKDILNKENKKKNRTTINISDNYFSNLYTILEEYKNHFDSLGYTIYSNTPSVGGKLGNKGNYAGTVDLLLYDNNNDTWSIIDLKTSTQDRVSAYQGEDKYGYKEKDLIQLNAYRELFYQKSGIIINDIKIMPLISKADDMENINYNTITKSKEILLDVDQSKSIYEILGIKTKEATEEALIDLTKFKDQDQDVGGLMDPETSGIDLAKLGIQIPEKAKTKKVPVKPITEVKSDIKTQILNDTISAFSDRTNSINIVIVGNTEYQITSGSYFIANATKNLVVTTLEEAKKVLEAYNRENPPLYQINETAFLETWKERTNTIKEELTKTKPSDTVDFDNMDEQTAKEVYMSLIKAFAKPATVKDIQNITKPQNTFKGKAQAVFTYLENRGISRKEIKTKCNI